MALELGDTLPNLIVAASGGQNVDLSALRGHKTVIYFYPKDDTPGCTQEGKDFSELHSQFELTGCKVFGVSRESVASHDKFICKYGFAFTLLSDPDETLCQAFDVMREKMNYGRKYLGIERSTFLFDADGVLRRVWRPVKVPGHAAEVLQAAQSI